ncbi:hypothetical protein I317_00379 [Kwoniella heveanensis CBS 569]|nr:hypothetical protein I317_00379 [Kwoniella heveanensis CBS 569]
MPLPNEILLQIVSLLSGDHQSLSALCRTSKNFNYLAREELWRHLKLGPYKPITDNGKGCGNRSISLLFELKNPEAITCITRKQDAKTQEAMKRHFEKVRIFSLREHSPAWCESHAQGSVSSPHYALPALTSFTAAVPFDLPNLQTLHLFATYKGRKLDLFLEYGHQRFVEKSTGVFTQVAPPCHFLACLRPRNMVIRQLPIVQYTHALATDSIHDCKLDERLWTGTESISEPYPVDPEFKLWSKVETFVLVLPACYAALRRRDREVCHPEMAPNLKKIYCVVDPSPAPRHWDRHFRYPEDFVKYNRGFGRLARMFPEIPITVVNFDSAWLYYYHQYNKNAQAKARRRLDNGNGIHSRLEVHQDPISRDSINMLLLEQVEEHIADWPADKLKRRLDGISFKTMAEYRESDAWHNVFDEAEMERWSKYCVE